MEHVDVGGSRLAVSDRGSGPPVLLHPGLGYATWCWHRLVPLLAGRWRVITVDPRGTGRSDRPEGPRSIADMADDLARVTRALDAAPAHLVGHSMGGYVVQSAALRHPDVVRSVALVATSAGGPDSLPVPTETAEAWRRAAGSPPEEFARATFHYSFRPGWPDARPDRYEEDLAARLEHPTPPDQWRHQYDACGAFLAAGSPVEDIAAPVLVVHGTADRVVPVDNAHLTSRRRPDATLALLDGAGHNLMLEEPEALAATLERFLDAVG